MTKQKAKAPDFNKKNNKSKPVQFKKNRGPPKSKTGTHVSFFVSSLPKQYKLNTSKSLDDSLKKKEVLKSILASGTRMREPQAVPVQAESKTAAIGLVKESAFRGLTRHVAIDCEFVGVGFEGADNMLARVSLVNKFGHVLLDKFVTPREKVVDYRTAVSGISPKHLINANSFDEVHKEVAAMIKGRVLVGHAVKNDLKVLCLDHPKADIRDTQKYKPFRTLFNGGIPSLRRLSEKVLKVYIQEGKHDSVTDAQATMRLYTLVKRKWETELRHTRKTFEKRKTKKKK